MSVRAASYLLKVLLLTTKGLERGATDLKPQSKECSFGCFFSFFVCLFVFIYFIFVEKLMQQNQIFFILLLFFFTPHILLCFNTHHVRSLSTMR